MQRKVNCRLKSRYNKINLNDIKKIKKNHNLRGFHATMLRKINLQLIGFVGIQSAWHPWRTAHFNNPPAHTHTFKLTSKHTEKKKRNKFYLSCRNKHNPLQINCDFVLESDWGIYFPLNQLLLKLVAGYLDQPLNIKNIKR